MTKQKKKYFVKTTIRVFVTQVILAIKAIRGIGSSTFFLQKIPLVFSWKHKYKLQAGFCRIQKFHWTFEIFIFCKLPYKVWTSNCVGSMFSEIFKTIKNLPFSLFFKQCSSNFQEMSLTL